MQGLFSRRTPDFVARISCKDSSATSISDSAAHAACYSMAFANILAKDGSAPKRLDVSADVTFDKIEAGWRIVSSALTVRGDVPGISADRFGELAEEAKVGCPISNALSDDIALSVEATLAG